ncbi:MAG TPA: OmpA family protein [Nitrospira sp.]|nr:OmpA family protein [Nitrospira sp.]
MMQTRRWIDKALVLGVWIVAACTGPSPSPPKELLDARMALQDARSVSADKRATRTYDSAAGHLERANKLWDKDHDTSTLLHHAHLAEAEARKAQFVAEAQADQETFRREDDRKIRNEIALRDAEIVLLKQKDNDAELERAKAFAKEQEQALIQSREKQAAERARAEREVLRLREEQDKLVLQEAQRAAIENETTRLREEQDRQAALAAEQTRADQAEREVARLRKEQERLAAQDAERAAREEDAARIREEQEQYAALSAEQARADQAERQVARLHAERDKSRAELTVALSRLTKLREEARGLVITLPGNVFFKVNKTDVNPSMHMQLTKIAKALAVVPDQQLIIEGHTDSDGSNESNQSLSELRAESVRKVFLMGGIAAERMEVKGYGESNPIADNNTPVGKAQNRRVEIVLVPVK